MNILAIDTATEACSVALEVDNTLYTHFEVCPQQHSQRLLPMIDAILKEAGVELASLDLLAFGRGPGSFTGVRIATGMIQGLALGTGLPVAGVSTLKAMAVEAAQKSTGQFVAVASDARMNEVYFCVYKQLENGLEIIVPEQVCPPADAVNYLNELGEALNNNVTVAGTGWAAYEELQQWLNTQDAAESAASTAANTEKKPAVTLPNAAFMLEDAKEAARANTTTSAAEVKPVYLRDKVTWKKLPGRE
ncbi:MULTISPECIES: tRNA (adenosine(37)-N6)-threonylcarbamoyltransferase complex dimerization subunit type 1 TsaB [unclassified Alteromonas]|uniref:tRNA (adenosine(37)-N6)-threonylcarbamoyltransferase complex dimerization subunit type 1 TsaB n=1 Tax=unclassified Alteromonas TaxID=2614992 RepID=UPI000509A43B|nr:MULTISPECIES: tRNA (adenosine(37)-N6)-threonylcarbamoyltransferase complex dimerization subunit type 1 TsaB [unclassified Alteromonas]